MTTTDPDFAARRAAARLELDAIDPARAGAGGDPLRRDWFEAVYARAGDDPARVPWAGLAPHPLVDSFVALQARGLAGTRALDVGCGLGDNAERLAAAGADVVAFDFVESAVRWARRRFPDSGVHYLAADLFAPPDEWRGGFDLINECYTLQALPPALLVDALAALAALLAPAGRLLIVARARDEATPVEGPPWPLPPSIFAEVARAGLTPLVIEDVAPSEELAVRHWRTLLRRTDGA